MKRILYVDDEPDQCEVLEVALTRLGYRPTTTTSPSHALELAASSGFDTIITDLGMSEMNGLALCERMLGACPHVPVVVLTGQGSMEAAIAAMRVGAYDFLTKPIDLDLFAVRLARAVQHANLTQELQRLQQALQEPSGTGELIGSSAAIKRVHDLIVRVAATDVSVLVRGETGTGKELVARALHKVSGRSQGPFVAINCAALPANLLESELFGHERGAFTDAKTARNGLFVAASNGTLFLDEIGEMPLEMQAKLLRALQERKVRPVGASSELAFDTRIVAATNRDIESDVRTGRFREDLFYRINVVTIDVPPLRDRGSDILKLAAAFLERSGRDKSALSPQVADRLVAYGWPGNVRELENCIERAVALARFDRLTIEDLPEKIRAYSRQEFKLSADDTDDVVPLDEVERRYILRVLDLVNGNKARAAQLLGLDRRTLYRKLERFDGSEVQLAKGAC